MEFRKTHLSEKDEILLNILADEYKELLIQSIMEEKGYMTNIDIRKLVDKDREVKQAFKRKLKNEKKERFYRLLSAAGLMYTVIGILMIALVSIKRFNFSTIDTVAFLATLTGVAITAMSYVFRVMQVDLNVFKISSNVYRDEEYNQWEKYKIVDRWIEFEEIFIEILLKEGIDKRTIPTSETIKLLVRKKYINEQDAEKIIELLKIRNSIVHGIENNYNFKEIDKIIENSDYLILKLRKITSPNSL